MLQFLLFYAAAKQKYSIIGSFPDDFETTIGGMCNKNCSFEKTGEANSPLIFVEKTQSLDVPNGASFRCNIKHSFPKLYVYKNKKRTNSFVVSLDKELPVRSSIGKYIFDKGYTINMFLSDNSEFIVTNKQNDYKQFTLVHPDMNPFADIVNKSYDISVFTTESGIDCISDICPVKTKKKHIFNAVMLILLTIIVMLIAKTPFNDSRASFFVFDNNNEVVFGDYNKVNDYTKFCLSFLVEFAQQKRKPCSNIIQIERDEGKSAFLYIGCFPFRKYIIGAFWYEKLEDGGVPKFKCTYESGTHGLLTPPQVSFSSFRDYRPVHITYTLDNNVKCTADLPATSLSPFMPHGHLVVMILSLFYDMVRRIYSSSEGTDINEYSIRCRELLNAIRVVIIVNNEVIANAKASGASNIDKEVLLKYVDKVEPGRYKTFSGLISNNTYTFISRLKGVYYESDIIVEIPPFPQMTVYQDFCLPFFAFCVRFIIQVKYTKKQNNKLRECMKEFQNERKIRICELSIDRGVMIRSSIKSHETLTVEQVIQEYESMGFTNFHELVDEIIQTLKKGNNVKQQICIQQNKGMPDIWHIFSATSSYDYVLKEDVATIILEEISQERKQELMMLRSMRSVEDSLNNQNFYMFCVKDGDAYMCTSDLFSFLGVEETQDRKLLPLVHKNDIQIYHKMMNGDRVTLHLNGSNGTHTFSGAGEPNACFIICTDTLTEVSLNTQSLPISSSASTVVFWIVNTKDDTVHSLFMQPTVWDLVGMPYDTPFSNFIEKVHPDDREAFSNGYESVLSSETELMQWSGEIRIMKAGGDYEWHRIALAMSDNEAIHCLATNTNKKKEVEFKLNETRQLRDLLLNSGKLALWKFNNNNREPKLLHKFTPGVEIEMNWTFINKQIPDEFRENVKKEIKKALESGSTIELDFPIILDDKGSLWVSVRGKGDAATQKVVGVCIDITQLRNVYDRLEEERKKAEEANRQKTSFLENMSHEIRTPMNGIFGMLDVLSLQELSSEQRLLVDSIRSSSFQLMKLLDDTLHLSKIEQGETEVELSTFSIWTLIEPTIIANYTTAKEKGVRLTLDVDAPFPSLIRADQQLFIKVFNNLLSNAIKFTKQGHIDIKLSYNDGMLKLVVADTGIGISQDQQQVIFERFQQADDAVARFFGGTGLGLALVQEIVKFLSGHVSVDSEVGKGSTFTVVLPLEDVQYPYRACGSEKSIVLIYIEDKIIQKQVITACKVLNYETKIINCPDDFQKNVTDKTVALFFESSQDNGKMIRDVAERVGKVSVCAITDPGETCIFKYNITRPAMFHHISKFLDGLRHGVVVREPELQFDEGTSRRCLVVEDNKTNQFVMNKMLNNLHCTIRIAENGAEAIDILETEEFDIVFMDCQMPVLDGLEATRRIRKATDKKYHQVPIVALTASAVEGYEEDCMSAGMDAYLPKPVRLQQITEIIKRFSQH